MKSKLEEVLSNFYKAEMVAYVQSNPEVYDEAIQLALSDKYPYAWRSAWLLWSCMEPKDVRFVKYIGDIIKVLPHKNDGHQRELIKILYNLEIDEEYEGLVFDLCVSIWEKVNKDPSVRHNAFKFILKIMKKYPELKSEITFLIQDEYLDTLSPGVRASIFRMIKENIK